MKKAEEIVRAICADADAAYSDPDCVATHIMFIQAFDKYDRRGPQAVNLGTMSRKNLVAIIEQELETSRT